MRSDFLFFKLSISNLIFFNLATHWTLQCQGGHWFLVNMFTNRFRELNLMFSGFGCWNKHTITHLSASTGAFDNSYQQPGSLWRSWLNTQPVRWMDADVNMMFCSPGVPLYNFPINSSHRRNCRNFEVKVWILPVLVFTSSQSWGL